MNKWQALYFLVPYSFISFCTILSLPQVSVTMYSPTGRSVNDTVVFPVGSISCDVAFTSVPAAFTILIAALSIPVVT